MDKVENFLRFLKRGNVGGRAKGLRLVWKGYESEFLTQNNSTHVVQCNS
jgi:hypothetical protein